MSTITLDTTMSARSAVPGWVGRMLGWMRNALLKADMTVAENRAIAELQKLDDRMLRDIGMSRFDIPSVVRGIGKDYIRHHTMPDTG